MALTQVSKDGVKNDAIDASKLPANSVGASELADNAVDTNAIADQAVALSKLPHGDGNSNGKFLRANNGADPTFESLPASGVTVSNNANNRVVTGDGTNLVAESTFTYDNGGLNIDGNSSRDGLKITQAGSYYGELCFNSNRTGENQAIGYIRGEWDGTEVGAISIEAGDDTTNKDDAKITFYTAQGGTISRKMAIEQDGHVHIDNGDLKFASGHGIDFSATGGPTNGSGSSELLDDYEIGYWTPSLLPQNGSYSSVTYNEQHGYYVKVGKQVTVWVRLRITSMNSSGASGYLFIQGLPFTVASASAFNTAAEGGTLAVNYYSNLGSTDNKVPSGYSVNNTTRIFITLVGEGSSSGNANVTMFNSANAQLYGCMTYFTA